jgi:hypothetical protein
MKNITILLALIAMTALTGCLQMSSDTVINKDGSGSMNMTFTMSLEVEEAFAEMKSLDTGMDEDMGEVPLFDDSFDKSALEKTLKKSGAKLSSYSNSVDAGNRTVKIGIDFKDAAGMQAAGAVFGEGGGIGLFETADGNYLLTVVEGPAVEEEEEVEPDMPDMEDMGAAMENAAKSMEIMGKLMSHMGDIAIEMRVTLPGDIISHNAPLVEGRTCIWTIDSSNMMSAQNMGEPEIVFSGQGLKIKAAKQ